MLETGKLPQMGVDRATSAQLLAACNWQRNLAALSETQPEVAPLLVAEVEWVFGRDGALTAQQGGKWWGGCSVPQAAAEELLRTLEITSAMACFLAPAHGAQVATALRRLKA